MAKGSPINIIKPAAANSWHILSEAPAFAAPPYLSISRHHVRTDSGVEVPDYWQVKLPDFAIAVALTESEEVITLWQYKHGARRFGLTFPAGHIEAGETPEAAMRRELIEETGYEAGGARALGNFTLSANQGCGMAHLFLMSRCRSVRDAASGDLERMELRLMSVRNVEEILRAGAAVALPHVAAWGAARLVWDGSGDHDHIFSVKRRSILLAVPLRGRRKKSSSHDWRGHTANDDNAGGEVQGTLKLRPRSKAASIG